jgi:hypothetical protein
MRAALKAAFCLPFLLVIMLAFPVSSKSGATEIQLQEQGGVYTVPARINGVITLNFILDSGAAEVCIPSNIVAGFLKSGTITNKDFLPGKNFRLADGSVLRSARFTIRELNIGGYRIFNIPAGITPNTGFPLLGQSFLNKIESWTLDNRTHKLTLTGVGSASPKEMTQGPEISTTIGKAIKSTGSASQPSSSTVGTTEPQKESARKLIPPSVHQSVKGQAGQDGSKALIEPSANNENIRRSEPDIK